MTYQVTYLTEQGLGSIHLEKGQSLALNGNELYSLVPNGQSSILNWAEDRQFWQITIDLVRKGSRIPKGELIYCSETYQGSGYAFRVDKNLEPPMQGGKGNHRVFLNQEKQCFGTASNCDIVLDPDSNAGQRDFWIYHLQDGRHAAVPDKNSTLTVNGAKPTQGIPLVYGDRITVGEYVFEFQIQCLIPVSNPKGGTLIANNLTLLVDGGKRTILEDASTKINPTEFIGVLGGSGQGKTTLLNCASGIAVPTEGVVSVNGFELETYGKMHPGSIGFVPQNDIVHLGLTVADALFYSAKLKMPSDVKDAHIHEMLDRILNALDILAHKDKKVGNLSGGQRKRVSIASELISRPQILFLDEPTSGLDPATEQGVMFLLRKWSRNFCPVVCTTHILGKSHLFDEVVFVNQARIVFQGPASEAPPYFGTDGLTNVYRKLNECVVNDIEVPAFPPRKHLQLPKLEESTKTKDRRPGLLTTTKTLFSRQSKLLFADKINLYLLLIQAISLGFLVGWGVENGIQKAFLLILASLWFGCSNASQSIVRELEILKRERMGGLSLLNYLSTKFSFWSIITLSQIVLFWLVIQATTAMRGTKEFSPNELVSHYGEKLSSPAAGFVAFLLGVGTEIDRYRPQGLLDAFQVGLSIKISVIVLSAIIGVALGLAISSTVKSIVPAVLFVPIVILPQIPLSGSMIIVPEMGDGFRLVSSASPCFQLKRLSDAGEIYGSKRPDLLNFTNTPAFVLKTENNEGETDYKAHAKGTAWQNLVVNFREEHDPEYLTIPSQGDISSRKTNEYLKEQGVLKPLVDRRNDVFMEEESYFIPETYSRFFSFQRSFMLLGIWTIASLGFSYVMLRRNTK